MRVRWKLSTSSATFGSAGGDIDHSSSATQSKISTETISDLNSSVFRGEETRESIRSSLAAIVSALKVDPHLREEADHYFCDHPDTTGCGTSLIELVAVTVLPSGDADDPEIVDLLFQLGLPFSEYYNRLTEGYEMLEQLARTTSNPAVVEVFVRHLDGARDWIAQAVAEHPLTSLEGVMRTLVYDGSGVCYCLQQDECFGTLKHTKVNPREIATQRLENFLDYGFPTQEEREKVRLAIKLAPGFEPEDGDLLMGTVDTLASGTVPEVVNKVSMSWIASLSALLHRDYSVDQAQVINAVLSQLPK